MSLTILEVLENARYNMGGQVPQVQLPLAKEQLENAIKALENGYSPDDDFDEEMLSTPVLVSSHQLTEKENK